MEQKKKEPDNDGLTKFIAALLALGALLLGLALWQRVRGGNIVPRDKSGISGPAKKKPAILFRHKLIFCEVDAKINRIRLPLSICLTS